MRRIIVDVDVGIDDYLALLILLYAEKCDDIKIEAICCTAGNTTLENVCKNTVRFLEITGRTDIPVYKGAINQIIPKQTKVRHHGKDGFGDLTYQSEPNMLLIQNTPATIAMYELVKNNPNEIDLICLAPLTNIALAASVFDDFALYLKNIYIMGGNSNDAGDKPVEFNFCTDPEAVFIVLDKVTCPVFILPYETCLLSKITYDWHFDVLMKIKSPPLDLLLEAEKKVYAAVTRNWITCDALLVAAYLYGNEAITAVSYHNATVDIYNKKNKGQLLLDQNVNDRINITIIKGINDEQFKDTLIKTAESLL